MNVCWQYQIKTKQKQSDKGTVPKNFSKCVFKEISYQQAKGFIEKYEWVGNMGTSKYSYGLFFESQLGGVVCFGPCVAPTKYCKIFGDEYRDKIIQLTRGATNYWAPKWCASKLISTALTYLKRNTPYRIVVAYADPEAGEIGTIYQACNALYIGETNPGGGKKYIIHRHIYDPRKVVVKYGSRSSEYLKQIDPYYQTLTIYPKHRYVFILGSKQERKYLLKKISNLVQDYPKRPRFFKSQKIK